MKKANIARLKNELSRYLNYVRHGESIQVLDRNKVIAQIIPVERSHVSKKEEERILLQDLQFKGIVKVGGGSLPADFFNFGEGGRKAAGVLDALIQEREEGR